MKINTSIIGAFASIAILLSSCGSDTKTAKDGHVHTEDDGHDHTEMVVNNLGQLLDQSGDVIVGCLAHKDMIGSIGDKCPKCDYMEMIPITWSLEGIDTVRVTTLPDYAPPK